MTVPAVPATPDPNPQLTDLALALLLSLLERFGNRVGPMHRAALHDLVRGLTTLALGPAGRKAFPLPTGSGKTLAIVAWCSAVSQLGLLGRIRVVVAATKVEALCSLKRDLISLGGVDPALIGLMHSFRFDPTRVRDGQADPGFATEPCDLDACARPILLATHQRVRGGAERQRDEFGFGPRNLMIWDESLLVSDARCMSWREFDAMAATIVALCDPRGELANVVPTWRRLIDEELKRQLSGEKARELELSANIDPELLHAELDQLAKGSSKPGLRQTAKDFGAFVDMTAGKLTVAVTDQGDGIISYRVAIPEHLNRVAVLDASYPIRELCLADKSVSAGIDPSAVMKKFDKVEVRASTCGSGREAVHRDLRKADRGSSFYRPHLCNVVEQAGPMSNVLVFTFKQRNKSDPDCIQILRNDLRQQGINPDTLVNGQPRVSFLTWGDETSLSGYKQCQHVVFVGVLHRGHIDLAAALAGQSGDLTVTPSSERLYALEISELAHAIYQAMSRGSCRITEDDHAKPMTLWLPMRERDLLRVRPLLEKAAPGLLWRSEPREAGSSLNPTVATIRASLTGIPTTQQAVSTRKLKEDIGLSGLTTKMFGRVLASALSGTAWLHQGRSVVRAGHELSAVDPKKSSSIGPRALKSSQVSPGLGRLSFDPGSPRLPDWRLHCTDPTMAQAGL